MRLEHLNLEFFGHFTNKQFDFGPRHNSGNDFHVIYGPNEAGKTTIMEAYLRLLYGFTQPEPYRFLHQRKNLRISATLEIEGQQRNFTRVPTRNNSLRDQHGTILGDGSLQSHLAGLSLADYRNLLCIDDETIEKGGEEIVNSKGDIGTLLFSAAAGIGDLSDVLDGVSQQADSLFRKSATKTKLATLKKEHADIDKQIKEHDVPASAYRKLRQAYDVARTTEQDVETQRKNLYIRQIRLEALIAALPLLTQIDTIGNEILPFISYPQHMEIKPEELVTLLTRHSKASNDADRLKQEIDTVGEELKGSAYEAEHLVLDEALAALDQLKSLTMVAEHGVDKLRKKCVKTLDDMKRSIKDLDAGEEVDPITFVVSPSVLHDFEQAREALGEVAFSVKSEQSEIDILKEDINFQSVNCAELEKTIPTDLSLIDILERFSAEELLPKYSAAVQLVERAEQDHQSALDSLASKGQRFESIPHCPLNAEEVEELISELKALSHELDSARKDSGEYKTEIAALTSQCEQIKLIDGLVSDKQASLLKNERNGVWSTHKDLLSAISADAFEVTMIKLDDAMEARLSYANDLGGLRQLEQSLAQTCAKADVMAKRVVDLTAEIETRELNIAEAVRQSGLNDSLSPKAFLTWVRQRESVVSKESNLHQLTVKYSTLFEKTDRLSVALSAHVHLDSPGFSELMIEARSIETRQRAQIEELRVVKERLNQAARLMKTRTDKLERLNDASTSAQTLWQKMVEDVFSDQVSADKLQASLQPLHALRELDKERIAATHQVWEMEQDQERFAQQVDALATRVGVEIKSTSLDTYEILKQLNEAARKGKQNTDALSVKKEEYTQKLSVAEQVLFDIAANVSELGRLFPNSVITSNLTELRIAVDDALSTIDRRARKKVLESELLGKLEADTLDDARTTLEALTATELQTELRQVQDKFELSGEHYKSTIEQRVARKKELDAVTGDAEMALLDQRKTTLALEMTEVAMQFLKLRTGHRLAEEAIRRYRDVHRSGMMQASENAFAELTNGAYLKLQTQADGPSETLMAVDKAGTRKQVQDMSKGTRFQLYLALRAAAYEQLCSQGTCLPFVCDDIFETFDEERTRSACRILDRIGQTGQAIYLTHHRHVVDIAEEVCGDRVKVHHIN